MSTTDRTKQALYGVAVAAFLGVAIYAGVTLLRGPEPLLEEVEPPPGAAQPSGLAPVDESFAAVARRVPAFGGMFVDGDRGRLNIWLTDGEKSLTKARKVLLDVFEGGGLGGLKPVALEADYSFTQLAGWYEGMGSVPRMKGVLLVHLEQGRNRIIVGVENLEVQEQLVETELGRLDVPRAAVVIQ